MMIQSAIAIRKQIMPYTLEDLTRSCYLPPETVLREDSRF